MTTMVETLQLENMGKPPLDALFCILCRGTILFPNVNWFLLNIIFKHKSEPDNIPFPNVKFFLVMYSFKIGVKLQTKWQKWTFIDWSSVSLLKTTFLWIKKLTKNNNNCLVISWIFQEDTAKYQWHLRLEHGVFYNRFGELMINYDDDDNDHDYGVFEYMHWLVGNFMMMQTSSTDLITFQK